MKFLLACICLTLLLYQVSGQAIGFPVLNWATWVPIGICSCESSFVLEARFCRTQLLAIGLSCPGPQIRSSFCFGSLFCGWSQWGRWSRCSNTCGGGRRTRSRRCQTILGCRGASNQTVPCNTNSCPACYCNSDATQTCRNSDEALCNRLTDLHCLQSVYSSSCPVRCNTCPQSNRRICPCGTWTTWNSSPCSTSCGTGTRLRTRQCTPPTSPCFGSATETISCNMGSCGQNRESWRPWGRWTPCSVSCGVGISVRRRRCSLLFSCIGVNREERVCNNQPCFGTVSNRWGPCSKTCGWGTQTRKACAQCPEEYQSCKTANCTGTCTFPSKSRYGLQSHDCCTDTLTPESCGIPSASNAQSLVNRFPWIGYVWVGTDFCATVLINNLFSLTSADCVWGKQAMDLIVVFGSNANDEYTSNEQNRKVQTIRINPNYTPGRNSANNIAILEFSRPLIQTSAVHSVCLPQGEIVKNDQQCIALEWQRRPQSTGNHLDRDLRENFLRIYPTGACNLNVIPTNQRPEAEQILCAGPNIARIRTCENVSGTPIVCQRCSSCAWMVAGISHQNSCSNPAAPQRFTYVSFHQEWINAIIPPANPLTVFPSCV